MQNTNELHPMMQCRDLIKRIYASLGNEYSKKMYTNRLLYNMTGDVQYIYNAIDMTAEGKSFREHLVYAQNAGKKIFIFGAGEWAKNIIKTYKNINFCGFIDNKPKAKTYNSLPVLSFAEYIQQKDNSVVIIATRLYHKEIYAQLKENNIKDDYIINAGGLVDFMSLRQYFDLKELRNAEKENEFFVDCGCFDGQSSEEFAKWHGNKTGTIYAFEPDPKNRILCEERFAKFKNMGGGGV